MLMAGPAGAADPVGTPVDPTTAREPTTVPTPVPTKVPPTDPAHPAEPAPPTTTPAPATIPDNPNGERSALGPDQTAATQAELAKLTDTQRALLRRLQAAKDMLAVRQFALVALAREVATARDRLDAARAAEALARARVEQTALQLQRVKDEIVALAAAAYRNHTTSRALGAIGTVDTDNASTLVRAQTYARSDATHLGARIDVLKLLKRRLESEQRVADLARAQAEASAADLEARLADQTQALKDATVATAAAQAAAARGLGSGASLIAQIIDPHLGADSITAALAIVQFGQGDPSSLDGIFALPIPGASLSSPVRHAHRSHRRGRRLPPGRGLRCRHAHTDPCRGGRGGRGRGAIAAATAIAW